MRKKTKFLLFSSMLVLAFIIGIILLAVQLSDYRTKHFSETMELKIDEITKIEISSPVKVGEYKITSKKKDVEKLINYLDQFKYKRLNGDKTARMPMKASIIYIYKEDQVEFIVPYESEAMITYKVYQIKQGTIEKEFLTNFYEEIKDEGRRN